MYDISDRLHIFNLDHQSQNEESSVYSECEESKDMLNHTSFIVD